MERRVYRVEGMSCEHCQAAVQQALEGVPGVGSAQVDLASAAAQVEVTGDVSEQALAAAVAEAGYRLVTP